MDLASIPHLLARQDASSTNTNISDPLSPMFNSTGTIYNDTTLQYCLHITPSCPVEETIYGYYPSIGFNSFALSIFAICLIAQTVLGIRHRTWTYLIALFFGCLGEALGYAGRVMLHENPWDELGFQIQICCLIISPAFVAAGVYLTLKHIVIELSPSLSFLKPRLYTWIFILCDILSLVLQGAGGGIAATADRGTNMVDVGNNLMMAGIVWQVVTLIVFWSLCTAYWYRIHVHKSTLSPSALALMESRRFVFFYTCMVVAFTGIFARCVYRIAEMSQGWASDIMQDEAGFIALEGVMILVAVIALTVAHPGLVFPEMQRHTVKGWTGRTEEEKEVEDAESGGSGRK